MPKNIRSMEDIGSRLHHIWSSASQHRKIQYV